MKLASCLVESVVFYLLLINNLEILPKPSFIVTSSFNNSEKSLIPFLPLWKKVKEIGSGRKSWNPSDWHLILLLCIQCWKFPSQFFFQFQDFFPSSWVQWIHCHFSKVLLLQEIWREISLRGVHRWEGFAWCMRLKSSLIWKILTPKYNPLAWYTKDIFGTNNRLKKGDRKKRNQMKPVVKQSQ